MKLNEQMATFVMKFEFMNGFSSVSSIILGGRHKILIIPISHYVLTAGNKIIALSLNKDINVLDSLVSQCYPSFNNSKVDMRSA